MRSFEYVPGVHHGIAPDAIKKVGNAYFVPGVGYTVTDETVGQAGVTDEAKRPVFATVPSHGNPYQAVVRQGFVSDEWRPGVQPTMTNLRDQFCRRVISWEHRGSVSFPHGIPVGYTERGSLGDNNEIRWTHSECDLAADQREHLKCIARDEPYLTFRDKKRDATRKSAARAEKTRRELESVAPGGADTTQALLAVAKALQAQMESVQEQNRLLAAQIEASKAKVPAAAAGGGK